MANDGGFQDRVKRLGELVSSFDRMADSPQKAAGLELIQLLMEVQAEGLERMMEIVFESGEQGAALIDSLGKDDVAGGLLLLYSLHPDALDARVEKAIERIRPRLRKLACSIDLVSIEDDAVHVRLNRNGHSCGSSEKELQAIIENGVYELAPDVRSLEILGLAEPPASGFVALDSLLGPALAAAGSGRASHAS